MSQAAIATVQPDHTNDILSCLQAEGIEQVTVLRSDGSLFRSGLLTHDIGTPETIGVDRLLGLLGARKSFRKAISSRLISDRPSRSIG